MIRTPSAGEEGSALLLFPAAVLVVLVLGAIAVDTSLVFLAERQLANATAAAANDAATEAFANNAFYRAGKVQLDGGTARRVATEHVTAAVAEDHYHGLRVNVKVGRDTVTVTAEAEVDHLFAGAISGATGRTEVGATSTARPTEREERRDQAG